MVAETHRHHDELDPDDIADYVMAELAQLDESADAATTTVADCGFVGVLGVEELLHLVAEEYGERTLTPADADELDDQITIRDLVAQLFPEASPREGHPTN